MNPPKVNTQDGQKYVDIPLHTLWPFLTARAFVVLMRGTLNVTAYNDTQCAFNFVGTVLVFDLFFPL